MDLIAERPEPPFRRRAVTYDLQFTGNTTDFLNNSHTLDAMAEHLRGRIDAEMSRHAQDVVDRQRVLDERLAKEKRNARLLFLMVIGVLLGIVLALIAL